MIQVVLQLVMRSDLIQGEDVEHSNSSSSSSSPPHLYLLYSRPSSVKMPMCARSSPMPLSISVMSSPK
jgi:hypothetical protein